MIRFVRLDGFLDEDETGSVKHTPMSAIFVGDQESASPARFMADFGIRPCAFITESMKLDPSGEDPHRGPLALMAREPGQSDGPTFFEVLENDKVNRIRWHNAMAVHNDSMVRHVSHAYDWKTVQSLVDVSPYPPSRFWLLDIFQIIRRNESSFGPYADNNSCSLDWRVRRSCRHCCCKSL